MKQIQNILYILDESAEMKKDGQSIIVLAGEKKYRYPSLEIEQIIDYSHNTPTAALSAFLAKNNIGYSHFSRYGNMQYRIVGETRGNVILRKKQCMLTEDSPYSLNLSKKLINSKLNNQVRVLKRILRNHPGLLSSDSIIRIKELADTIPEADSEEGLRGIEGLSARIYFEEFSKAILTKSGFKFSERHPHRPQDPVNILLSFGYTLLKNQYIYALESVGLDPYIGFFHSDRSGKPSLALDIMEESRSPVTDRFVIRLINLGKIRTCHFENKENTCSFTKEGSKIFLAEWQKYRFREVSVRNTEGKITMGMIPFIQAQRLSKFIREDTAEYEALIVED